MISFHFIAFGILLSWSGHEAFGFEWEENKDESLFESDIKLLFEQQLALKFTRNIDDNTINFKRGTSKDKNKLWPGGIFPYEITEDLRNNSKAVSAIREAFDEWETQTCIKFVPRTNENDYVVFFGSGEGCWSFVGKIGGMQQISLAKRCWQRGTIAHEIGHALGFWHEQSRPDRDDFVEIIWHNIPEEKRHNFRKYNRTAIDSLGVPYDYISVMHYSSTAFGGGNTTIKSKDPSVTQLGQRAGLSPLDIQQADALYQCNGDTTVATQPPPTRPPPPSGPYDCTFENGMCGYENVGESEGADVFDWTLRLTGTPSGGTGPLRDHGTDGRFGHFIYIETSSPREPGDVALLRSPDYPAFNANQCFRFYYHMYGKHIGELNVYSQYQSNTNAQRMWSEHGNKNNTWNLGQIQLKPSTESFKIIFEGIRGEGYQGDIAIDDIHFVSGTCS